MDKSGILFWDVDTQYDFMHPQGKLYVPGSEDIIETVVQIRRFALENGFSIIASTDWHSLDNEEISDNPDFQNNWPPHCMAETDGARRIGDPAATQAEVLDVKPCPDKHLKALIAHPPFQIVLRKNNVDIFTNPNTPRLLELIHPTHIIVFGVALDVCVRLTVESFLKETDAKITVVKDAVRGIDPEAGEKTRKMFAENDVDWLTFEQVKDLMHEKVVV